MAYTEAGHQSPLHLPHRSAPGRGLPDRQLRYLPPKTRIESTEKLRPSDPSPWATARISLMAWAVRTGKVLSTTIVWPIATLATRRAQASTQRKSLADQHLSPWFCRGIHGNEHHVGGSNRLIHRSGKAEVAAASPTTTTSTGSYTGSLLRSPSFQAAMRCSLMSTTVT